jgi:hypothetical protein
LDLIIYIYTNSSSSRCNRHRMTTSFIHGLPPDIRLRRRLRLLFGLLEAIARRRRLLPGCFRFRLDRSSRRSSSCTTNIISCACSSSNWKIAVDRLSSEEVEGVHHRRWCPSFEDSAAAEVALSALIWPEDARLRPPRTGNCCSSITISHPPRPNLPPRPPHSGRPRPFPVRSQRCSNIRRRINISTSFNTTVSR